MRIGFKAENVVDAEGRPAGGSVHGTGFAIEWQNGPLGKHGSSERIEPNGAFVEDVIDSAVQRIEHYQGSGFACRENELALVNLKVALMHLDSRTKRRVSDGTEGTHEGS